MDASIIIGAAVGGGLLLGILLLLTFYLTRAKRVAKNRAMTSPISGFNREPTFVDLDLASTEINPQMIKLGQVISSGTAGIIRIADYIVRKICN